MRTARETSRAGSFFASLVIHVLAVTLLVAAGRIERTPVKAGSKRRAKAVAVRKVLWYTPPPPPGQLPPVTPADRSPAATRRPKLYQPRQAIAAASRKPESSRQLVLQSPPQIRLEQDVPASNTVAWTPPKARLRYQPERRARTTPQVEAPQMSIDAAPAAPQLVAAPVEPLARPRYQAPAPAPRKLLTSEALAGPDAPAVLSGPAPSMMEVLTPPPSAIPRPIQPKFEVRAGGRTASSRATLEAPDAPAVLSGPAPAIMAVAIPRPIRPRFEVPAGGRTAPSRATLEAPEAPAIAAHAGSAVVVVGLNPAPAPMALPPGNRSAEFSAGPEANGDNGGPAEGLTPPDASIRVPGLTVAAAAAALTRPPLPNLERDALRRELLRSVPKRAAGDGLLRGSTVYTLAIDMPNITSYDGSWILRFTEVGGSSPDDALSAPVARRKVDPKYNAAAADEGVEGKVLLYAVIRRDGAVDRVRLVKGLDERLDSGAVSAFSQWQFHPGTRNGEPVDLEAVVQIPFRLRPRAKP